MTLSLLCQFTAQHVSDVNTSIFRSLRLLGALLCRLYCAHLRRVGVMWRDWLLVMWYPSVAPEDGCINIQNMLSSKLT